MELFRGLNMEVGYIYHGVHIGGVGVRGKFYHLIVRYSSWVPASIVQLCSECDI